MPRKIVVVGWDGRSNPIYCFQDELTRPAHMRTQLLVAHILEQFPDASYTTAEFKVIKLRDLTPIK